MKKICATVLSTSLLLQGVLQPVYSTEIGKSEKEELSTDRQNVAEDLTKDDKMHHPTTDRMMQKQNEIGEMDLEEETDEPAVIIHEGTIGTAKWTIDSKGVLKIGAGELERPEYSVDWPWSAYHHEIKKVDGTEKFKVKGSLACAFSNEDHYNKTSLIEEIDLSGWDVSEVVSLENCFRWCEKLKKVDFSNWQTSSLETMDFCFSWCGKLESLDINHFDVSNIERFICLFDHCSMLRELNVSDWDTSSARSMNSMFRNCGVLSLDLQSWNMTSVTDIESMFAGCDDLVSIDLNAWDTSNIKYMDSCFFDCRELTELGISEWNTSNVISFIRMFSNCFNLKMVPVSNWDVSSATHCSEMFYNCRSIESLDLSAWNPASCPSLRSTFSGCTNLKNLDVSGWNIPKIEDFHETFKDCKSLKSLDLSSWKSCIQTFETPFRGCEKLETLKMDGWDITQVTSLYYLFEGLYSLNDLSLKGWDFSNVEDISFLFCNCASLKELDLSDWGLTKLTDMDFAFAGCESLINLKTEGLDTSKVTDFRYVFSRCKSIKNSDAENWDVSSGKYFSSMFKECESLEKLDLSRWDVSNAIQMDEMFSACYKITDINTSGWDTSSVETFEKMFCNCDLLTNLDLNHLNTSSALNLSSMFSDCDNLSEIHVEQWDVSKVEDFQSMFSSCISLDSIDLNSWDTSSALTFKYMFSQCVNLVKPNIENFNTHNAQQFSYMFINSGIENADFLNNWDMASALQIDYMFSRCEKLKTVNLNGWNFNEIRTIDFVFHDCPNLEEIDISSWNLSTLEGNPREIFVNAPKLTLVKYRNISNVVIGYIPRQSLEFHGPLKWYLNDEGPYQIDEIPEIHTDEVIELRREDHGIEVPEFRQLYIELMRAPEIARDNSAYMTVEEKLELEHAIRDGRLVLETLNSTQEEVDRATQRLVNIYNISIYRKYKYYLTNLVSRAEQIADEIEHYEDVGIDNFYRCLDQARDVLSSESTDPTLYEVTYSNLLYAMNSLVKTPAPITDKVALKNRIDEADKLSDAYISYMDLSEKLELYTALADAKKIFEDEYAEQTVIDEAEARLTNSYVPVLKQKFTVLLTETIAEAEKIESELDSYLEEGKEEFITALNLARESVAQADAGYEELYRSLTGLQEAMSVLELRPVPETNKEALTDAIEKAEGLGEEYLSQFSEEQRTEFDAAMQNARDVLADKYAEQDVVDQAESRLMASYVPVLNETFRSLLSAAITEAEKAESDLESYKEEGREPFLQALQAAREMLANTDAGYEELHGALTALQTAMSSLELRPIPETNKTELADRIEKAESLGEEYLSHLTEEEKTGFEAALENARKVYADKYAEQDEVDQAEITLKNSYVPILNAKFRTLLSETVASAADIEPELESYKEEGREAFRAALKAARETLAREDAGFQDYHSCAVALQNAMSSLELRPVPETNKESLLAAIEKAENLEEEFLSQLNEAQRSEFDAALTNAKDVLADKYAEQEEVDQAGTRLVASYIPVLNETYRSLLRTAVAEAEKTEADLDSYKDEGKAPFAAALETARAVLSKEDADYREMSASLTELQEAMANLELRPVPETNKEALTAAIEKADTLSDEYISRLSEEQKSEFETALAQAKKVCADKYAEQEEVDQAESRLIASFVPVLNEAYRSLLSAAVEEAEKLETDLESYKEEGRTPFLNALHSARETLSDDGADYEVLNGTLKELQNAVSALELRPVPDTNKAALAERIEKAESLDSVYLSEMNEAEKAELEAALENARKVYADKYAEQEEADQAETRLMNAYVPVLNAKFRTLLAETLNEAAEIESDLESYKEEGREAFRSALKAARETLAREDTGFQDYHSCRTVLQTAISALELRPVPETNKESLSAAIDKAEGLGEEYLSQFSEEQRTEFDAALQNARDVLADKYAEQDEVDQAESRLKASYVPVLNETFRSLLSAAIIEAEKAEADLESYKEEGRAPFLHALQAAREMLNNTAAGYEELHGALTALQEAMSSLELRLVPETDKGSLSEAITKAENLSDDYLSHLRETEKAEFDAALGHAKDVFGDKYAEQTEVDEALNRLENSYIPVLNTSFRNLLTEAVAEAAGIEASLESYKEEGREAFLSALKTAREALAGEETGYEVLSAALSDLQAAVSALELRPVPDTNKENLATVIEKAEKLSAEYLSQMSEEEKAEFDAALSHAREIYADKYAEQSETDQAASRLTDSFVPVLNGKFRTLLSNAVEEAAAIEADLDSYKEDGKENFQTALQTAREKLANETADYEELNAVLVSLQTAVQALEPKTVPETDKGTLSAAIEKAENLEAEYLSMLDEEARTEFDAALANAKKVLADRYAEQAEIDQAAARLNDSYVPALNTGCRALLSKAAEEASAVEADLENYKEEGKAAFLQALKSARDALAAEDSTYEVLHAALQELQEAMSALELIPIPETDKEALQTRILEAMELKEEYLAYMSEEEKAEFDAALANAKRVYADKYAEQTEVDQAELRLTSSYVQVLKNTFRGILEQAVSKGEYIEAHPGDYEETGMPEFLEALNNAREILSREDAEYTHYYAFNQLLQEAAGRLVIRPANTETAEILIEAVEVISPENFTPATWAVFEEGLEEIRQLVADGAPQSVVDQAVTSLHTKYLNLRMVPSEDQLQQLLGFNEVAETLNMELYAQPFAARIHTLSAKIDSSVKDPEFSISEAEALCKEASEILNLIENPTQEILADIPQTSENLTEPKQEENLTPAEKKDPETKDPENKQEVAEKQNAAEESKVPETVLDRQKASAAPEQARSVKTASGLSAGLYSGLLAVAAGALSKMKRRNKKK